MKEIINGERKFLKIDQINYVTVPMYDECKPQEVIEKLNLKSNDDFLSYCPEVMWKNEPKDREFFFNVVNTLYPH